MWNWVETAPNVFLPKRATQFTSETGTAAKKDGRAGWARWGPASRCDENGATSQYSYKLFELASLPVPKDVQITDSRGERAVVSGGPSVDIEKALLATGKAAPAFEVPLSGGGVFKSKDSLAAKKHVLLTFWYCACPPCESELAYLGEIHKGLQQAGIEVVAVNLQDEPESVKNYITDRGLKFKVGLGGRKMGALRRGHDLRRPFLPHHLSHRPGGNRDLADERILQGGTPRGTEKGRH